MFKIIKEAIATDRMYTLHGFVGDPKERNDRYIQVSIWTGEPVIQTRCGYMAGNVVCFYSKEDAYAFIERFMTDPNRKNKHYINWQVIDYRPYDWKNRSYNFREVKSKYGKFCRFCRSNEYYSM